MEKRAHSDRCYTLPDELVILPQGEGEEEIEVDLMIEVRPLCNEIIAQDD